MENVPATPAAAEIKSIAIDQLRPNPWNRTLFDPEAMKDLVASLKAVGVKEGKLKSKDVEKRCNQLRFAKSQPHQPEALAPDPLASVWPDLQRNLDFSPDMNWQVQYGPHKSAKASVNGWFFSVTPTPGLNPKRLLAIWFQQMATALEGGQPEPILSEVAQVTQQAQTNVLDAMGPIRLPKIPAEQKELEELAKSGGPKAVYVWIYGKDSPMVQAVPASTWEELGMTPQDGLKQILDGIRLMQGVK